MVRPRARRQEPKLSREWTQEIESRVRDLRDPVRYMLVSEFSRTFILYYDISQDVFAMNAPDKGTLFKRRQAAERIRSLLSHGIRIVKFTTKGGRLKRLSPFEGPSLATQKPKSRWKSRGASSVAKSTIAPARRASGR
jgi:hypothetical protein